MHLLGVAEVKQPRRCQHRPTVRLTVYIPKIPLNVPSVGIISSLEAAVAQPGKSDRKVCFYLYIYRHSVYI